MNGRRFLKALAPIMSVLAVLYSIPLRGDTVVSDRRPPVVSSTLRDEPSDSNESLSKPNVLMIIIDDLNDWISVLGHPTIKTPNFDRLAERSVTFNNAYCPAPICVPSRTSFLTGVHPSKSGAYFNNQRFFTSKYPIGKVTTLPGHFKKNGYDVVSYGKVFHINRAGLDIKETEIDFIKTDFNEGGYIPTNGAGSALDVWYKLKLNGVCRGRFEGWPRTSIPTIFSVTSLRSLPNYAILASNFALQATMDTVDGCTPSCRVGRSCKRSLVQKIFSSLEN